MHEGENISMAAQKGAQASLATLEAAADAAARDSAAAPGFRHLLGTPRPPQRLKVYGADPLCAPAHLPRVRALMNRLSRRMDAEIQWPSHADASLERWENPRIPSGYTYLLQFVAHDLVHSAVPLSVAGTLGAGTANARRTPLQLETLFGSGPVGSPFVYALDAPNDDRRTKLRLRRLRSKDKQVRAGSPIRDTAPP